MYLGYSLLIYTCSGSAENTVYLFYRLHFDSTTGEYFNTPGVETRVPGFGNTSCVENLDPTARIESKTAYFDLMVQRFVHLGYTRGKDIGAAPFDWRMGPSKCKSGCRIVEDRKYVFS